MILRPFVFKISEQRQQDEVKHEQSSADPEDRVNFSGFSGKYLYDAVEYKSCGDTIGNAVAEGHEDSRKECRNCFVKVIPVYIFK